jgi:hypothetical protein
MIMPFKGVLPFAVVLLAFLGNPPNVHAHDKGVLKIASRIFGVGDRVDVRGEEFRSGAQVKLVLVGVDGRRPLGDVKADTGGRFGVGIALPSDVRPGLYRIVAVAADGDEISGVNVELLAGAVPDGATMDHAEMVMPSAEPLDLERAASPLVTGVAGVLAGLSLLLGVVLLRAPARKGPTR